MAMLKFNRGLYSALKNKAIVNGNVYITTDEKAMYVDIDDQRIRLGQIVCLTQTEWEALKPPYSPDAFYYLTDANAMLKYTGGAWKQINGTQDLKDRIGALETAINDETNGLKAKITGLRTDLDKLVEDVKDLEEVGGQVNVIETVKVNGTALIPDTNKAVDIILGDLAALDKVDTDHLADALKTRLTNIENKNTTQDTALNTLNGDANTAGSVAKAVKDAVTNLKNNEIKTVEEAAAEADRKAQGAQNTANTNANNISTLQGTVSSHGETIVSQGTRLSTAENTITTHGSDITKLKTDVVTAKNQADKGVEDASKAAAAASVADGKAAAAQKAVDDLEDEVTGLKTSIGNLANVMNFRGVVAAFSEVTDPKDGDVIIIGNKEYVYSDGEWYEYGDASVNGALIEAIDERVTDNTNDIIALEATVNGIKASEGVEAVKGLVDKVADNANSIKGINTTIEGMYTNDEIDNLFMWGRF